MCKEHIERLVEPYPEEWKDRVREQLFIAIESEGVMYHEQGTDIDGALIWDTTPQGGYFWYCVYGNKLEAAFDELKVD